MTTREWTTAKHSARWVLAYLEALRAGRRIVMIRAYIDKQLSF